MSMICYNGHILLIRSTLSSKRWNACIYLRGIHTHAYVTQINQDNMINPWRESVCVCTQAQRMLFLKRKMKNISMVISSKSTRKNSGFSLELKKAADGCHSAEVCVLFVLVTWFIISNLFFLHAVLAAGSKTYRPSNFSEVCLPSSVFKEKV